MQNKKVSEFIADKKLKDLEWRFSVAVANSLNQKYNECFLQTKITTIDKTNKEESLQIELNLKQFYELYTEVEKIKNLIEIEK